MPDPLVSVIMPAYNAEQYIAESIETVIQQTFTNWELLVVDDGSTDATKDVIQQFCAGDARIKYYWQPNGKQGKARNLALSKAKGSYIAFLDADDVWMPEKLTVQLNEIQEKKADLVFSDAFVYEQTTINKKGLMQSGKGYFSGDMGLHDFLQQNRIPILTVLAKAEVMHNASGFIEEPSIQNAEDYHLWLRLLLTGKVLYGSEAVLAGYREHATASTIDDKLSVSKVIEAFENLKQQYKPYRKLLNTYHRQWFKRYHYSTSNWNKKSYQALISKNCSYLNRSLYNLFFQAVYSFFGLRVTRKLITKVLNGSVS